MKNVISFILTLFIFTSCGSDESESTQLPLFKIQPGTLTKYTLTSTSYNIIFNGAQRTGDIAIIDSISIDDQEYVGIAVSDDPSNESFNMKIYFYRNENDESAEISDKDLTDNDVVIKINQVEYSLTGGSIILNFEYNESDGSYRITSDESGSPELIPGNISFSITEIIAINKGT
ncbi:MAG: hypothetical protein SVZ03_08560 [Spirochaetota bacterium]|nr:hypothetical protein [Spirochaetota bacterium]